MAEFKKNFIFIITIFPFTASVMQPILNEHLTNQNYKGQFVLALNDNEKEKGKLMTYKTNHD